MGFAPDELRNLQFLVIVGCAGRKYWVDAAGRRYGPCVDWICLLDCMLRQGTELYVLPPYKDRPEWDGRNLFLPQFLLRWNNWNAALCHQAWCREWWGWTCPCRTRLRLRGPVLLLVPTHFVRRCCSRLVADLLEEPFFSLVRWIWKCFEWIHFLSLFVELMYAKIISHTNIIMSFSWWLVHQLYYGRCVGRLLTNWLLS